MLPDSASGDATSAFRSIRDRFPFKRNTSNSAASVNTPPSRRTPSYSQKPSRSHHHRRRLSISTFRSNKPWFYLLILLLISAFAFASIVLQSSITSVFRSGENVRWRWMISSAKVGLELGSSLRYETPVRFRRIMTNTSQIDRLRSQPRIGIQSPRIALILGNMVKDPSTLMLYSVMKNIKDLGYDLKIYTLGDGGALSTWQELVGQVSILAPERYKYIDWSIFEGVIVDSLEVKNAISSLMQEPFCSVPLIWIIQEDTLANRLQLYNDMAWDHLISNWKSAFSRADVVVFPEFSFPMLYSVLDTGNFFVIPGSPVDVWAAESYSKTHSRTQLRKENHFGDDDLLIVVFGSSLFYSELAWDYAVAMHDLEPLLLKYAGPGAVGFTSKFVFLCGNSSKDYSDALQDAAIRLRLNEGSLKHYGINEDVDGMILMADIVLYASSQDEQGFPILLTRAMSFGIPIVASDNPVIRKYVVDGVHGVIFPKNDPEALESAFSPLIAEGRLSRYAHTIASSGRLHAKNMFAAECIISYAKLLENLVDFPSDVLLPSSASDLNHRIWEWKRFRGEADQVSINLENLHLDDSLEVNSGIVHDLEVEMTEFISLNNVSHGNGNDREEDVPTMLDWDILREMEGEEEVETLEREEIELRMEKSIGEWDEIYRNTRKSDKLKFEINERDEGELERTGQPICIYEIYSGAGGWPFLHHGSLYRGLSLSSKARRLKSDDVDAVSRLPILNNTYYRDILCEIGGMFAIANGIDDIHKRPWIGFQSWRAAGRKVSLSKKAEEVLEKTIQENTKGDVIYFWTSLDMDGGIVRNNDRLTFWSTCDIMNAGMCRTAFEDAFRRMYGLPSNIEALPPMPEDGGHWAALHSWVMPTPSFLEFTMFARMFVDSLHNLHSNLSLNCSLGFSSSEKQHCYCRLLEALVNVWAYHSARKMVYVNPRTGFLQEQHPVEKRKEFMWVKYFNATLLKNMDEDLAEAADDNDHPYRPWLWPLTGEVYWQGIYEREREERYRLKMDKKRKTKEKLIDRLKHGYAQKTLG